MESKREVSKFRTEWRNERGYLHRLDGPSVEWVSGGKDWCINGNFHREDGPARIWKNGDKQWWLNGEQYSEEQWEEEVIKLKLNQIKDL